jgi:hypothetical protein
MTLISKLIAAGGFAAVVAFPVSAALAQESAPMANSGSAASSAPGSMGESNSMGSSAAQGAQIDDATLQKAARAYVKVKKIVHEAKQSGAASAQADQSSAQADKLNAVKNEGLDPQQYNQILQTVQNDPQLQQKFASYVTQNGGDAD